MPKIKVFLLIFTTIIFLPSRIFAADLNWTNDTNITIGLNTYVIGAGSSATSLVVDDLNIIVSIPSGSYFNFQSDNRFVLNNTAGLVQLCESDNSVTATGPLNITITPDPNVTCGGSGSGAGNPSTPSNTNNQNNQAPNTSSGLTKPNGTLIVHNGTVYLIKDGQRIGFRDASEYQSHGYKFSQAVPASEADLNLPLGNAVVKALEGTLVLDKADGKTVYMIGKNGTKRGFASADVFNRLGYKFGNLPKIDLTDYPTGEVITNPDLPHPEGSLVLNNGTVWWIIGGKRVGFESEAVFNTYGFDWSKIVPANSADINLSEGNLVKFRDGTLVKDNGSYYIISEGKKRLFASIEVMQSKGFNISNAITASLAAYQSGEVIE